VRGGTQEAERFFEAVLTGLGVRRPASGGVAVAVAAAAQGLLPAELGFEDFEILQKPGIDIHLPPHDCVHLAYVPIDVIGSPLLDLRKERTFLSEEPRILLHCHHVLRDDAVLPLPDLIQHLQVLEVGQVFDAYVHDAAAVRAAARAAAQASLPSAAANGAGLPPGVSAAAAARKEDLRCQRVVEVVVVLAAQVAPPHGAMPLRRRTALPWRLGRAGPGRRGPGVVRRVPLRGGGQLRHRRVVVQRLMRQGAGRGLRFAAGALRVGGGGLRSIRGAAAPERVGPGQSAGLPRPQRGLPAPARDVLPAARAGRRPATGHRRRAAAPGQLGPRGD